MVDYWDYAIHLPSGAFSAVNTKVLFDADVSAYANRQGVMTIMNSTVLFSSSVVLSGNSDNPEAAMDIHNSSAVFGSSFVCNGSGQAAVALNEIHPYIFSPCGSGGCLRAVYSDVSFHGPASFSGNMQYITDALYAANCGHLGGAISCSVANITFHSDTTFTDNSAADWEGFWSGHTGGGAVYMTACNITAEGRLTFVNNTAGSGSLYADAYVAPCSGAALYAYDHSVLQLLAGAEFVANSGSAVYLSASSMIVKGAKFSCINNTYQNYFQADPLRNCGSCATVSDGDVTLASVANCVQGNEGVATVIGGTSTVDIAGAVNFHSMVDINGSTNHPDVRVRDSASFTCSGRRRRVAGSYRVVGDICAPSCVSSNCTCQAPSRWIPESCSCGTA